MYKYFPFIFVLLLSNCAMTEPFKNTNGISKTERSFSELLKWRRERVSPDRVEIEISDEWKNLNTNSNDYSVWIGHSTFLIKENDLTILTDPIFSQRASPFSFIGPKRLIPPAISIEDLPKIDVITISHNHYDHLDIKSLKKISKLNPEAIFLIPKGDKHLLKRAKIKNVFDFIWWDTKKIKGMNFTYTPVQHWSARGLFDRSESLWGGWFMKNKRISIFHAGDTGYTQDFKETYTKLGSPDFAMIPIGAYSPQWFMSFSHVNPSEAVQIALDLKAKRSIGMHWGTFILTDEPVLEPPSLLNESLEKLNLSKDFFQTVKPGKVLKLYKDE
jgi:L-ascorbate metabolism protein UlaG (beta-lactamase superfamily)